MGQHEAIYSELREAIAGLPVADSHEHTLSERTRREEPSTPFSLGYVGCDLCGAGASDEEAEMVENPGCDPEAARDVLLKYLPYTSTTAYGRSMARTLRDVFGIERLDRPSFERLRKLIASGVREGSFERWFKERLNIHAVILDVEEDENYPDFFFHSLRHANHFILADSREDLERLEALSGRSIHSAGQMRDAMWTYLERLTGERGAVALKNNLAYSRSLFFEKVTPEAAERSFNRFYASKHAHHASSWIRTRHASYEEMLPLQNWLVHESIRFAGEHGLVYQVHTGLQAGYTNEIADSRPTLLTNLFREYRGIKFVLFHGGFPYCREWGVLGKNFPNVWLDLCWIHIISPSTCVRMIDEWLDYLPYNKLLGFGGDLHLAESVYGHLEQARDNLARALAAKVGRGDFDLETALAVAENMLFHNVVRLYGLSVKYPGRRVVDKK